MSAVETPPQEDVFAGANFRWQIPCYIQSVSDVDEGFVKAQSLDCVGEVKGMRRKQEVPRKAGRPGGVDGQRVRDYPQVSIRVPPKLYAQLAALTRSTGLSRLEIFIRALDCYESSLRAQRRRQRRKAA